ncbi:MAG TPA: tetratricopeptide repeat protein [Ktedonobacteraceae bacterium]|jgi:serine/threonine protein kinase/cytochrome c-type biogenesis protein CcmH/NrfG|nr:tetratricopeptide repeat protein [Ktedonobacteraceae bacterium]
MALPIGTVLDGKFKIVQVLGEGGMGTVYKVEQLGTTPPYYYAVKELLINPNTSEEDRKSAIERFNKEIALLRGLKHPRIAALALPFQDRGNYYFAMEFVPGRSLEKMLEDAKGPLPDDLVIKWMIQVCEALSYIHTRTPPIILRDLKPGNIMVTMPGNEVQLIDFGIARRFDPNKRTNTENLGTISYASPEHLGSITAPGQRRSMQNPGRLVQTDARSDIYSLGATMYHLITDYEPDPIQTPAPGSIRAKNPRLRTMQVSNALVCPVEQVIIKAMQQDPAHRFQSAEAMRMALLQCLPGGAGAGIATPATVQIPAISPNATIIVPATNGSNAAASASPVCPRCGFYNRPGAKFCKRDGQPLVHGATVVPPPLRAQPVRSPIQARPVQQPLPPRHSGIQARPIQRPLPPHSNAIPARPTNPGAIVARVQQVQDPAAAYRAGLQQFAQKNYAQAVQQFQQALKLGRPSYDLLYNLGRAYRQYGQSLRETDKTRFSDNLTRAAENFEQATNIKSDALDAYFQLGMCARDLGLYQKALDAFKKAQTLSPRDPAVYYQLGLIQLDQGAYNEAEKYLQGGLKIQPDHAFILIALGCLQMKKNKLPRAISTLRQVTKIDPTLWEGWYELGRAHMLNNEWLLASSALEQAQKANPYALDIHTLMATCYLRMNKKMEARHKIEEVLKRDPNNAEAIRLQKQL